MENYNIDDFDSAKATTTITTTKNGHDDNRQEEKHGKEQEEQRGRDKDRGRDRSRSRERSRRSRSRERVRRRSRSRDRRRSRSRDRRRSRSRDRRRSRSRERRRSRSRDRRRSRSRDRRRSASASVDPREVGKTDAEIKMQREVDSLTKDQRTVFVGQLVAKVTERMLKDYFGEMGKVSSVLLLRDKHTGRHKGCGYVEMRDLTDVPNILLLNNSVPNFQKYPILVKPSEAEKNFAAKKPETTDGNSNNTGKIGLPEGWDISRGDPRIYIGSIHASINEEQLKSLLSSFGHIEELKLHKDELGNSKGFGFARYAEAESAQVAITGSKGIELFGKALKIGPVNDGAINQQMVSSAAATLGVKSVNEAAVSAALAAVTASAQANSFGAMSSTSNNWKLDEDDSGRSGMKLDANSRLALMAKLGQGAGIQVPTMNSSLPSPIAGQPSTCFMLKNMFDPAEETEANWDLDIKEDVMEESGKFGSIEHCHVEKKKPGGLVFLKFSTIASAVQAANNLNNRFFGKRQVIATFLDPQQYQTLAK